MTAEELQEIRDAYLRYTRAVDRNTPGKFSAIRDWQKICTEKMPSLLVYVDRLELRCACLDAKVCCNERR